MNDQRHSLKSQSFQTIPHSKIYICIFLLSDKISQDYIELNKIFAVKKFYLPTF